jgi:hypothetical protein
MKRGAASHGKDAKATLELLVISRTPALFAPASSCSFTARLNVTILKYF